jgi:hypothetical protein
MTYPAKTPPASTKQALKPSFHQKTGESGLSSGSSPPPSAIRYSCPALKFVGEARANNFERDARIGTAEEACRLYAILVGGIIG